MRWLSSELEISWDFFLTWNILIWNLISLEILKFQLMISLDTNIFYTKNFNIENSESLSWNLDSYMKVFNTKLFAIEKVFELVFN